MLCPSCASENPADSRFCEDCGAFLEAGGDEPEAVGVAPGPLAPGHLFAGSLLVERVVDSGGTVNLYEARRSDEPARRLLVQEVPGSGPEDESGWDLLSSVREDALWRPGERLEEAGRVYLVGPWPGVESLQQRLAAGGLPVEQVARMGEDLLRALEAVHQAGWLHRGLSPEAIWLDEEGRPVLVRCERARPVARTCEEYSVIQGYSSPEAYGMQGGVVDVRSDLYSLGAVLYSALTGQRMNLEARETFFFFPRPQVPGASGLLDVILRAVEREPARRYSSAEEMRLALEEARAQRVAQPSPGLDPGGRVTSGKGYRVALKSDIGLVRRVNQDAWLECRLAACERDVPVQAHLVVVADGMGGEAEGDKAASLAVRAVAHEVVERFLTFSVGSATALLLPEDPGERNSLVLKRALERANRTIHQYASQESSRTGMGCTMTACLLEGDLAVFGHVGDTRGFRIGATLDQVTTDHSLVGSLVQMGHMTREEARHSPRRSVIYRALGTAPEVEVDLYRRRLEPGDYLLICSDGVWEYYDDQELLAFFQGSPDPETVCNRLVQTCLARGADDNATAAVVRWD